MPSSDFSIHSKITLFELKQHTIAVTVNIKRPRLATT